MKYLETKHEKDSAKITTLIVVIILLLLFVVGPPYMDPPEEYGVAVNFGNTDFGSGNIQPKEPVKSEPREVNRQPEEAAQPEQVESQPAAAEQAKAEEVVTQNTEDAIAIKKQKEADAKARAEAEAKAKAQAEADAKAKAEAERVAKEKAEQEAKKKKLDALIGGVSKSDGTSSGSEGDDNRAGDKGQLDGDPYAPSYFGGPGSGSGGVGYGLNGRGKATYQTLRQDCNEAGMVIVKIVVNRNGDVIEATPGVKGTTNTASCLLEPARKIALSHKWRPDSKAPAKQIGFVRVNFTLGQ
ncbi:energy transducer TonB [Mangrovimonas sp. AS39]|uniref:energy transducer TonB n=1 Tax=Mangrovimonas futianensis TaxID=2895523 RepID=UPI001E41405E|nr:energy transducer TonB [Mangrovimonas futianensis]MCF1191472.1 energy transducer TonB [Mangrovimonas futianensis]MCF1195167.1 energy transducer TonB [Mangrovimonas futianensis]